MKAPLALLALGARIRTASASMASPWPYTATNDDGSQVKLKQNGDEWFHYESDVDGFPVVKDAGAYVYATPDLAPTAHKVGAANPAKIAGLATDVLAPQRDPDRRRRLANGAPVEGPPSFVARKKAEVAAHGRRLDDGVEVMPNLLIPLRFADHTDRTLPSVDDMNTIMNHEGAHTLCPTGSVRDVFLASSHGALDVPTTTADWVTVPGTEADYAAGQSGLWSGVHDLFRDGLDIVDASVDFGDFDSDNDGWIDGIAFLHSGYGAEWGGTDCYGQASSNRIWSHKWGMSTWTSADVNANGVNVKVSTYHVSPGLWGTCGSEIGRIGVIAHESGHYLGYPDYYDYGAGSGIGSFDLMANSWGFDGTQYYPPMLSARLKAEVGWITPTEIEPGAPQTFAVAPATTGAAYKVPLGDDSREYLLIENRQAESFDGAMPQSGLAIWHIDESHDSDSAGGYPSQSQWPSDHYYIALQAADGDYDLEKNYNRGDAGDVYHGAGISEMGPLGTSHAAYPRTAAYITGTEIDTGIAIYDITPSPVGSVQDVSFTISASGPPTFAPTTGAPTAAPNPAPTPSPVDPNTPTPEPTPRAVCELSEWSEWSQCEYKDACRACDYGASEYTWERPYPMPQNAETPLVDPDRLLAMQSGEKMAKKRATFAAFAGDDPDWRFKGDKGCAWVAENPRRCFTKKGALGACAATCRPEARGSLAASAVAGGGACGADGHTDGDVAFECSNVDLEAWHPIASLLGCEDKMTNDNWGWTNPTTGTEWVIVGCSTGTTFFRATDGAGAGYHVATQTASSSWRDIKVYDGYALIGSEAGSHGLQVVDMAAKEAEGAAGHVQPDAVYSDFGSSHNVVVNEETGMAYAVGSNTCNGGLHAVDVRDPLHPVNAGCAWDGDYVHDAQCVVYRGPDAEHVGREICVLYSEQEIRIVDVTDLANPSQLGVLDYDFNYAHQGWFNCEQTALFVDDELDESGAGKTRTYVVDVRDLDAPALLTVHESHLSAIDHNQYVCGAYLYQANYEAGLRILDSSKVLQDHDPDTAAWAHYDEACVSGANMPLDDADRDGDVLEGLTVGECQARCEAEPGCVAVEVGVDHGGGSDFGPGDCRLQSDAFSTDPCDGGYANTDLYTHVVPGYNTLSEVAYFDTHPQSTNVAFNGAWNVFPYFESGLVVANAIGDGVAVVRPTALPAQTRTRTVVGNDQNLACGLLIQERSCDNAPTPSPVPAPTPSPTTSHAPTRDCDCAGTATLELTTDGYPAETIWRLDMAAPNPGCPDATATGGPYDLPYNMYEFDVTSELCAGESYTFTIFDAYGDGICCSYGDGAYKFKVGGATVAEGGEFTYEESTTWTQSGDADERQPTREPTPAPSGAAAPECGDDPSWRDSKKGRDCDWVAKKASKNCKSKTKNEDGVSVFDGCQETCMICTLDCAADSSMWYSKKSNKDCDWVADKPSKRCKDKITDKENFDGVKISSERACPVACGTSC